MKRYSLCKEYRDATNYIQRGSDNFLSVSLYSASEKRHAARSSGGDREKSESAYRIIESGPSWREGKSPRKRDIIEEL
jgi:hypothetical protein